MEHLISFVGYFVLIGLAVALSSNRKKFPWRVVIVGSILQFVFAAFIINTTLGQAFFETIGGFFTALLGFVHEGSKFVFGTPGDPEGYKQHYFAFVVLPTIIFMSTLMSILYYLRIMQGVVEGVAWIMQRTMGLSGAESLSAAANIFVGQTEAPLVIKPYVATMTKSDRIDGSDDRRDRDDCRRSARGL
jgi:concentrative nucleoside transporter, CNT family